MTVMTTILVLSTAVRVLLCRCTILTLFLAATVPLLCFTLSSEQVPAPVISMITSEGQYDASNHAATSSSLSVAASAPSSSSSSSVLNAVPDSPYALSYSPSATQASLLSSSSGAGAGAGATTGTSMTAIDKSHPRTQTDMHGENEDHPGHKRLRVAENDNQNNHNNEGQCAVVMVGSTSAIQNVGQVSGHIANDDTTGNDGEMTVATDETNDHIDATV